MFSKQTHHTLIMLVLRRINICRSYVLNVIAFLHLVRCALLVTKKAFIYDDSKHFQMAISDCR